MGKAKYGGHANRQPFWQIYVSAPNEVVWESKYSKAFLHCEVFNTDVMVSHYLGDFYWLFHFFFIWIKPILVLYIE